MPKFTVTIPIVFDEVEADSPEDAANAIVNIATVSHRRCCVAFSPVDCLNWHPRVEVVSRPYCITLSEIECGLGVEPPDEETTAATA
jgi:hypothetical protein